MILSIGEIYSNKKQLKIKTFIRLQDIWVKESGIDSNKPINVTVINKQIIINQLN